MNRRVRLIFCAMWLLFFIAPAARAAAPSTAPTTAPYIPHVAILPKEMRAMAGDGFNVMARDTDEPWVKKAVAATAKVQRPSTMPSDLLNRLTAQRDAIVKQIQTDLAVADTKPLVDEINTKVMPALQHIAGMKPKVYFLPTTQSQLDDLMRGGWSDPRFRYNRLSEQAEYGGQIVLSLDAPMDDLVIWVELKDADNDDAKSAKLTKAINHFQADFIGSQANIADDVLRNAMAELILKNAIVPLKLPDKLDWFGKGIAAVYATKYSTEISGASRKQVMAYFTAENPDAPISPQGLDLFNVISPDDLRPQMRNIYYNAMIRKGAAVIDAWVTQGGDGVFAKVAGAIKLAPPQDAQALQKLILDKTSIDLTAVMRPNYHAAGEDGD